MIVMRNASNGSLKKNLPKIIKRNWQFKLRSIYDIICGLERIHQQKLIHCDLHDGNILRGKGDNNSSYSFNISDLGLTRPVEYFQSLSDDDKIYGRLPFIAPEILRYKAY